MSAPQSMLQAAVNRLAARLGSGLADSAATLSLLLQDAPGRLQQEVSLFWEEVLQEAERLERQSGAASRHAWEASGEGTRPGGVPANADPQDSIDALRAQVARLTRRLDGLAGAAAPAAQERPRP